MTRVIKKAVITGATGFIGRRLTAVLKANGVYVVGIARRKSSKGPWDRYYSVDFGQSQIPDDAFEGADVVFHLAGVAHDPGASDYLFEKVNIGGTQKVLDQMKKHGVGSIVYFSSVAVFDVTGNDGSCNGKSRQKVSAYAFSKYKAERLVLESDSVLHACVLRPPLVYGVGCPGNLERMIVAIKRRRFPAVPSIRNRRSMVHVDDLVNAAVLAAIHSTAHRKVYVVTDGRKYSTGELYNWIRKALGKPVLRHGIPAWTLSILAAIGDVFNDYLRLKVPFDSSVLEKIVGDAFYSSTRIEQELGFYPKQDLHSVLPGIVAHLDIK